MKNISLSDKDKPDKDNPNKDNPNKDNLNKDNPDKDKPDKDNPDKDRLEKEKPEKDMIYMPMRHDEENAFRHETGNYEQLSGINNEIINMQRSLA